MPDEKTLLQAAVDRMLKVKAGSKAAAEKAAAAKALAEAERDVIRRATPGAPTR